MRKLIWLLIAILTVNMTAFAVTAEAVQETPSYENYYFLKNIGLLEGVDGKFNNLSENVTRAEFVSVAIKIAVAANEGVWEAFFSDVPESHWAAEAIYAAVSRGLVSKTDKFNPDDIITLEQAYKIVVSALGYGEYAEFNGGWPIGYTMQAKILKLGSGVKSNGELTKYDALCIIRNALDADVMQMAAVGTQGAKYESFSGRTPLTEIYDIYTVEGIVDNNGITGIKSAGISDEADRVMIGGNIYLAGETNVCDYIGQNVKAYYKDDDVNLTLLHVETDTARNTVITVMSEDAISYSGNVFRYFNENGKEDSLRTTPSLSLIYNGKKLTSYTDNDILIPNGEITFIDNNDDNVFDVILSYNYESYYVEAVNASSYTVVDGKSDITLTRKLILDPDDKSVRIYDASGTLSDFSAISNDTVITVFRSADDSYAEVYTYGSVTEAVIKAISTENGKRTIVTETNEYLVENSYKGDIRIGENALIYLNAYGRVAFIDSPGSELSPAYLINYHRNTTGLDKTRKIKVLSGDGDLLVFTLADKVKLNDSVMTNADENLLWGGNRKPILYKTNSKDVVTHIYTPQTESEISSELRQVYADTDTNSDGIPDTTVYYRTGDGMFIVPQELSNNVYPHFCTSSDVVFFGVPTNADATDDDYIIYDTGSRNEGLPFGSVNMYSFKNTGLVGICEVFYNAGDTSSVSWGDVPFAVVSEPRIVLNEDGEMVNSFTNLVSGTEMYIEQDANIDVHEGDIILIYINKSTGYVKFAKKLYCSKSDEAYTATAGSHGRAGFKGTITKIEQGTFTMEVETGEKMTLRVRGTVLDMVEKRKPVISNSTALSVGSEIVVYLSEGFPLCIMMLK